MYSSRVNPVAVQVALLRLQNLLQSSQCSIILLSVYTQCYPPQTRPKCPVSAIYCYTLIQPLQWVYVIFYRSNTGSLLHCHPPPVWCQEGQYTRGKHCWQGTLLVCLTSTQYSSTLYITTAATECYLPVYWSQQVTHIYTTTTQVWILPLCVYVYSVGLYTTGCL